MVAHRDERLPADDAVDLAQVEDFDFLGDRGRLAHAFWIVFGDGRDRSWPEPFPKSGIACGSDALAVAKHAIHAGSCSLCAIRMYAVNRYGGRFEPVGASAPGHVAAGRKEMVGLIQKLLFDLISEVAGPAADAEVRRRAGVPADRRFCLDAAYPDDEWQRLLGATCNVLGKTQDEIEQVYAEFFGRDALRRWPVWFAMSPNARQFLERQQTIHNTFATGMRDADARRGIRDKFRLERRNHELITHYRSPNQLCGLYKALARWVLNHYRESATIEEMRCTKSGDPECEIHIRWPDVPGAA